MKKELNTIYTDDLDHRGRITNSIYFEYDWYTYKVIKYPVWFSYSRFSISRVEMNSILWFEYESLTLLHDELKVNWNKWPYNGTSKLEPPKEVFVEVFEKYMLI